jgi:hypothetical protein
MFCNVFHKMFRNPLRNGDRVPGLRAAILIIALLASPCAMFAQHGGHGGGSSIGGGLNGGGGRPSGVDSKDDLKDFHAALAVQATSQQIAEYLSMAKSTTAASTELRGFLEQAGNKNNEEAGAMASRGAALEQAIEKARTENKTFLEGFSGPQKSGLKETTRKLTKAESELTQHSQELKQRIAEANAGSGAIAASAQTLEHALTSFQNQQASLGEEMGIVDPGSEDFTFNIAPMKTSISFHTQAVVIVTSGVISGNATASGQNTFAVKLTEDISDLQQNITDVLRAQLNKSNVCGERIAIQDATIMPSARASLVVTRLHFERWACFGSQNNEIAEGDGTLEVKLTPEVAADGTLRITPAISRIEAEGLLAESLRTGSLGSDLRDEIADAILSAVRQAGDFKVALPPAARSTATLHRAEFQSTGAGALTVMLEGTIPVPKENASALVSTLKEQTSSQKVSAEQISAQHVISQ